MSCPRLLIITLLVPGFIAAHTCANEHQSAPNDRGAHLRTSTKLVTDEPLIQLPDGSQVDSGLAMEIPTDTAQQENNENGTAILNDLVKQLLSINRSVPLTRREAANDSTNEEILTQDARRNATDQPLAEDQQTGEMLGQDSDDINDRIIPYDMIGQNQWPAKGQHSSGKLSNYKLDASIGDNSKPSVEVDPQRFPLRNQEAGTRISDMSGKLRQNPNITMNENPTVANSSLSPAVVDQVEAPISRKILEETATSDGYMQTATTRSATIQPRAMHSGPPNLNKSSQHTRPPYASHDQFQVRSGMSDPSAANNSTSEMLVASSINRISAHLAGESARGPSPISSQRPLYTSSGNNEQGRQLEPPSGAANPPSTVSTTSDDKKLDKLANSVSQLVELDPIPAGGRLSQGNSLPGEQAQDDMPDKYYIAKDHPIFEQLAKNQQKTTPSPLKAASSLVDSQQGDYLHAHSSGQTFKAADIGGGEQVHATRYNPMPHRQVPTPTHYAASLINVTAPMVPPLWATEAMEADLGNGQAAKTLLQQASGFIRQQPPVEPLAGIKSQHQPHLKPVQQLFSSPFSESIYSQPANKFSPKPHAFDYSHHHSLSDQLPEAPQTNATTVVAAATTTTTAAAAANNQQVDKERMRLDANGYLLPRKPIYPERENLTHYGQQAAHAASGFRSPLHSSSHLSLLGSSQQPQFVSNNWASANIPLPANYFSNGPLASPAPPPAASPTVIAAIAAERQNATQMSQTKPPSNPATASTMSSSPAPSTSTTFSSSTSTTTTNGFITGGISNVQNQAISSATGGQTEVTTGQATNLNRRVFNLTRVEHISAECSNDLIRTVIVFNGTFKGIIYSSGYVRDPNCLYINGTGKTRYDFSIRLNQCGTLNRQELRKPTEQSDIRRRDQVMWNTLSIQYNPIIEQEWDEHFRVSCEYGSDFWKTISFNPFNVETNTGSPVVFTVEPPQCQMEIFRGHGMVGPRQEAISGPVTVGDPLTLLIHMKSEKAGYDILVKNCIAHDGSHQKMQLIDTNGCVVNERFISPFRGNYNDQDLKHITLYSYLKAFRFTGSPVLYIDCEIHMCQSSCPPQMCYWRRLSKRSLNETSLPNLGDVEDAKPAETTLVTRATAEYRDQDTKSPKTSKHRTSRDLKGIEKHPPTRAPSGTAHQQELMQRVSLEVRQERELAERAPYSLASGNPNMGSADLFDPDEALLCYRQAEVLAFFLALIASALIAISVAIAYCWRITSIKSQVKNSSKFIGANLNGCQYSSEIDFLSNHNDTSRTTGSRFPLSFVSRGSTLFQGSRYGVDAQRHPMTPPALNTQTNASHSRRKDILLISPRQI